MKTLAIACALAGLLIPVAASAKSNPPKPFMLVKGKPAKPKASPVWSGKAKDLSPKALAWLAKTQADDGRWTRSSKGKKSDDEDVVPTALGMLAFMASGNTHRYGTYKRNVHRAIKWLRLKQTNGRWASGGDAPTLSQALATYALCEVYMISRDFTVKPVAQKGLRMLLTMEYEGGAFGFAHRQRPNAFATVWVVLALKNAKVSGLAVPKEVFDRASEYLRKLTAPSGMVGYSEAGQGISLTVKSKKKKKKNKKRAKPPRVPLFTAGSIIARLYAGERRSAVGFKEGRDLLNLPHPDLAEPCYWFFGTSTQFQLGETRQRPDAWKNWSSALVATLGSTQSTSGKNAGSWKTKGVFKLLGGKAGVTALNVMTVEIIARYQRARGGF